MTETTPLTLAGQYMASGRLDEAHRLLARACDEHPDDADTWHLRSAVCGQMGLLDEAAHCAQRTVTLQPRFRGGYVNLGLALRQAGKIASGVESLRQGTELLPADTELRLFYAAALESAGRNNEAVAQYRILSTENPDNPSLQGDLGNELMRIGSLEDAATAYHRAVLADGTNVPTLRRLAHIFWLRGRFADAAQWYRTALAVCPTDSNARVGLASSLERSGDFDGVLQTLEPELAKAAPDAGALVVFALVSRRHGREQEAIRRLKEALTRPDLPEAVRRDGHFALGDLLDRLGRYDEAFENFRAGNQLRKADFDPVRHRASVERVKRAFDADFMRSAPRASNDSPLPVFIVGMPRSGTSLTEQILASHPAVAGGGELQMLPLVANDIERLTGFTAPYPERIREIPTGILDAIADRYLSALRSLGPSAERVTDKLPGNWWNLGLVDMLFPHARIIHVQRDPRDSALSCYFQNFSIRQEHTFDLSHLGSFYRDYHTLMRHWQSVLRVPVLNIRYEELVTNFAAESRRLVEFCDLEWDPRCAQPHATARAVNTASYDQVRQPVYASSIGRWKHYERHLGPLLEALAEKGDTPIS